MFSASVYDANQDLSAFHEVVRDLATAAASAHPTPFHYLLETIAAEGRLLRLYSQNIDCIDTSLHQLHTTIPLPPHGPWPPTIQLHGSIKKTVCISGRHLRDLDPDQFVGPDKPLCKECDRMAGKLRKRSAPPSGMRPRFTLYDETGLDDKAIEAAIRADVKEKPDAIIVVGTSLAIPSIQQLVLDTAHVADLTVWINPDPPPHVQGIGWDLIVQGSSDDVARGYFDSRHAVSREDRSMEEEGPHA